VESVNDVWHKLLVHAVTQLLLGSKELVRSIHKCPCNIYGIAAVDIGTIGHWTTRLITAETGKAGLFDLPRLGCPIAAI
jgi:hypothetical protein